MENLDVIDRLLLVRLDTNARAPITEIAKHLRRGRDIVNYRYGRLVESGLILGSRTIINPSALGLTTFKWYVKLRSRGEALKKFLATLDRHPAVSCYAQCAGAWDLIINIFAKTPSQFNATIAELIRQNHTLLGDTAFSVILRYDWHTRSHIAKRDLPRTIVTTHQEQNEIDLDDASIKVLEILLSNARMPAPSIAKSAKLPEHVVRQRIQHLEQTGVIANYRLVLNRRALGLSTFKMLLGAIHPTSAEMEAFRQTCRKEHAVVSLIQQIGRHNIEFNIEAPDYDAADLVAQGLEEKHPALFEGSSLVIIRDEFFRSSLPLQKDVSHKKIRGNEAVFDSMI